MTISSKKIAPKILKVASFWSRPYRSTPLIMLALLAVIVGCFMITGCDSTLPIEGDMYITGNYYSNGVLLDKTMTRFALKNTNEIVNNDATLQNDNELFFAGLATRTYWFRGWLLCKSSATADIKIGFSATASLAWWLSSDVANNPITMASTGTKVVNGDGNYRCIGFEGKAYFSNNDTLYLMWSQNTAEVYDTYIYAGSILQYWRMN